MGRFFGDGFMKGKSVDVEMKIEILKHIRTGNLDKATEMLEILLDGDLIGLSRSSDNSDDTNESIRKAANLARDYRASYPRHTNQPGVDSAVEKAINNNASP